MREAETLFQAGFRAERLSWEQDAALLAVASTTAERFRAGSNEVKRETAKGLLSNLLLDGGKVRVELSPSFKMIVEAHASADLNPSLERQLENWLPIVDSNHD